MSPSRGGQPLLIWKVRMSKKPDYIDRQMTTNYRGRLESELIKRGLPGFLDWLVDEYAQHIDTVREQQERITTLTESLWKTAPNLFLQQLEKESNEELFWQAREQGLSSFEWGKA